MHAPRNGFTLIELAIVLAILGLIAGGIMGGQTLVKASRVRGVLIQANSYATATTQFTEQYGELPGDFSRAARVWNGAASGNGNGVWEQPPSGNAVGESFQSWLHLMKAGYISGSFTGRSGAANINHAIPEVNSPAGTIRNTLFWAYNWGILTADTNFFPGDYTNILFFGTTVVNDWPHAGALTSAEAYGIDSKVDDGMPGAGDIRTLSGTWMTGTVGTCITPPPLGNDPQQANYLRSKSRGCILVFLQNYGKKNRI